MNENDLIVIQSVLEELFEKQFVIYDKNAQFFAFPVGGIIFEDNIWKISYDYSCTNDPHYLVMATILGKVLAEEDIDFEVYEGYYTICNEQGIRINTLWDSDIWSKAVGQEMSYEDAKKQCIEEIMKNNKKENLH